MSSRPPLLRALLFVLAFVPVAWGTCPRWVAGEVCGAAGDAAGLGEVARCPCCPPAEGPRRDGPQGDGRQGDGQPGNESTDPASCPVIQLRFTVAPAPTDVAMPVADLVAVTAIVDLPRVAMAPRLELAPRDTTGGAPPPRVGTVVLRI